VHERLEPGTAAAFFVCLVNRRELADNPQMTHSADTHPWATMGEPSTCGTQHGCRGLVY